MANGYYHPRAYVKPEYGGLLKEYEYLTHGVTLWDVGAERQIRLKGADAFVFANYLVTRELEGKTPVNQARYVILCYDNGGIVNDPVLLRVADDEIWLSIGDSVLGWARGVNQGGRFNVSVDEIDVAPVQLQGPQAKELMSALVGSGRIGDVVLGLGYYQLCSTSVAGCPVVVSRTGYSGELGYEIYLYDATKNADTLWDALLEIGREFDLQVIAPSHIRRLEAGILAYGADMDAETSPFEVGLDWQVNFEKTNFVGRDALRQIRSEGVKRRLVGLKFGGPPITWYISDFWPVRNHNGIHVGYITSSFYSPHLDSNIAFAMVPTSYTELGTEITVDIPHEKMSVEGRVVPTPFFDARKEIPKSG